ncbi:hypothetical protein GMD78_18600 [Ornithinibacillus sp. L9]|uniref:Uncharacterized protein n=1 Tax=Ornithinibacillus caprae TaxID=2678566 RepID=A0A6N8FL51_9BACI|nr:hypothetical protein [Ornithinibacillus caprae]MUK90372.1 hypothetical protein [Ornithinibacillus caprae]
MRKYVVAFVLWALIVGTTCYVAFNGSGKDLILTDQQMELTIEEAQKQADIEMIEINDIPFESDTSVNLYHYRYGSESLQKVVIVNKNDDKDKSFNLIISPESSNLQSGLTNEDMKQEAQVELNDGTVAYYYEKDLGERIQFEKDGLTYGLYHLTQFEDPYGEEEMINFANQLIED